MALGGLTVLAGLVFLGLLLLGPARDDGLLWSLLWWALALAGTGIAVAVVRTGWRLIRPPVALALDDSGYRIDPLAGAGTRVARWVDVARVEAVDRRGEVGAVLHLHDGTTSRVVARMVAEPMPTWLADFDTRLNRAHGQRRL